MHHHWEKEVKKGYEDYVNLNYKPKKDDLICEFYFEPNKEDYKRAAGAIAAESSIGTWTFLTTTKPYMLKLAANVFYLKKRNSGFIAKEAYPKELFEYNNMPNILSSVAGNIFGMKEINNLRLNDIIFPKCIVKAYKGPKFGIDGVRKILNVYGRPLLGTIVKPKLGLNSRDHAQVCYDAWIGGCDIVKDDENLSSQSFNKFKKRLIKTLKMKRKAEFETGEKKIYMINITAETNEMLKRMELAKKYGNEYVMIDVITVGWSALQTVRHKNEELNLVLHGHRAMHAILTKNLKHGISMKVLAKIYRIIGIDQLHIGTGIGKMFESLEEVKENVKACVENVYDLKQVFPVCSGGLHPGHVPFLIKNLGKDIIIQMGGGIHGHPVGTVEGAKAARQSIDAAMKNIPLEKYAKTHIQLKEALQKYRIHKREGKW